MGLTPTNKLYSNVLLLNMFGKKLSTISNKKANQYIRFGSAEEIQSIDGLYNGYTRVVKLNFPAKKNEPKFIEPMVNQCVICGDKDKLTWHHILPKFLKKHFPVKYKSRNRTWNVLLCVKCHKYVEVQTYKMLKNIFPPFHEYRKKFLVSRMVIGFRKSMHIGAYKHKIWICRILLKIPTRFIFRYEANKYGKYVIKYNHGYEQVYELYKNIFNSFKPRYLFEGAMTIQNLEDEI